MADAESHEPTPKTVGVCPVHHVEFYMPDAKPGERCPTLDCEETLLIYESRSGVCQELAGKASNRLIDMALEHMPDSSEARVLLEARDWLRADFVEFGKESRG